MEYILVWKRLCTSTVIMFIGAVFWEINFLYSDACTGYTWIYDENCIRMHRRNITFTVLEMFMKLERKVIYEYLNLITCTR